ncbi:MAG: phage holin family protein [Chloroflexi bacterium]|nr:phage holin family protein [Chloroflexota bacterium]MBU1748064.1 phage holin family protein [Chloroflexota bacterium]
MLVRIIIRVVINVLALLAAIWLIPGIDFVGEKWWMLIIVALIFGVVNALIRPIVMIFSCPLLILTLGLFTIIINAAMLMLTAWISNNVFNLGFYVYDPWAAVWGALVVSVVSFVLTLLLSGSDD